MVTPDLPPSRRSHPAPRRPGPVRGDLPDPTPSGAAIAVAPDDMLTAYARLVDSTHPPAAVAEALAVSVLCLPAEVCGIWFCEPADAPHPVALRRIGSTPAAGQPDDRDEQGAAVTVLPRIDLPVGTLPVDLPVDRLRRRVGLRPGDDLVICPLPGHDGTLGLVVVGRSGPDHGFAAADLHRLEPLARLAGAGVDSARALIRGRAQAGLMDSVSDAVVGTDSTGQVVSWNRAAERVYGIPATVAIGEPVSALLRTDYEGVQDGGQAGAHLRDHGNWRGRVRQTSRAGVVVEVESSVSVWRDEEGAPAGVVEVNRDLTELLGARAAIELQSRHAQDLIDALDEGADRAAGIEVAVLPGGGTGAVVVQSDVSWRRRLQEEMSHRATHDELTGLPNRVALRAVLDQSLDRLDGQRMLAVLFCDLDGFKDVNDGLGHAVGDLVLVAVAKRLRQRCRSADVVARFGGDEFVVVLTVPDSGHAVSMAERIVEVLSEPVVIGDAEVAPGVSIGITVVSAPPEGDDPAGTLLRDADTAMYQAKERGRGRFEFFDAGLRKDIERRVELSAALHRAVPDGELRLRYQTRRLCGTRVIAGVEALLQWQHPHLGLIKPETFIPIAERTGRIVELGGWALDRALAEFAAVADPRLTVAVNVSPRQLTSPKLPGSIDRALAESGLEPSRLVLEITEGALVDDPTAARAVLTDLRKLGVVIALDDFGTGWSSLSYLRTLPVDVIKIDRTFVADLPTDLDACAVVSAVLNLGHGMGLVVVAEGVEREDQLAVLREMGCDEYQGFIDGRPGALELVLG